MRQNQETQFEVQRGSIEEVNSLHDLTKQKRTNDGLQSALLYFSQQKTAALTRPLGSLSQRPSFGAERVI